MQDARGFARTWQFCIPQSFVTTARSTEPSRSTGTSAHSCPIPAGQRFVASKFGYHLMRTILEKSWFREGWMRSYIRLGTHPSFTGPCAGMGRTAASLARASGPRGANRNGLATDNVYPIFTFAASTHSRRTSG